ncbi:MAG: DUF1489 domain-containing protein [Asticcacaulis sp.]
MSDIHLIKLCVGADNLDDLLRWEKARGAVSLIHTRNRPTRWQELLDGGSLYWVIKGVVLCRREIVSFDYDEAAQHWLIGLNTHNYLTEAQPRRAFQGWRYLKQADAPRDIIDGETDLPPDMMKALKEAGVW